MNLLENFRYALSMKSTTGMKNINGRFLAYGVILRIHPHPATSKTGLYLYTRISEVPSFWQECRNPGTGM